MTPKRVPASLDDADADADAAAGVRCPECGEDLRLTQPDEETPGRLIGVCPACKAWYLVDLDDRALVPLPLSSGRAG